MILAGDIGGTSTRLALFEVAERGLVRVAEQIFPSRELPGLAHIVAAFLAGRAATVAHACFGIAGPVKERRVRTTNLPWIIDADALLGEFGYRSVTLINDLEAITYGIAALAPEDFLLLNPGAQTVPGNQAVIAAGTGLGEAGLLWDGSRHRPMASEGGHVDFAPRDDVEIGLLRHLAGQFGHVSYERVLSGPGLVNIYRFLRDARGYTECAHVVAAMREGDAAAVISRAALDRSCPLCVDALNRFVSIYGAAAGNLALKLMATGGVFIGGGIAPKIIERLNSALFFEAYRAKGRMSALVEAMPVRVILNEEVGLLGAARRAGLEEDWVD